VKSVKPVMKKSQDSDSIAICWIRRDLRLSDHLALSEATSQYERVVVLFIFDSRILEKLDSKTDRRLLFIYRSLQEMDQKLRQRGSALLLLEGDPSVLLPKVAREFGAKAVFTNEDYEGYARKRDQMVGASLDERGIRFIRLKDQVIFSGSELKKADATPYRVFTPYKNAWLAKITDQAIQDHRPNLKNLLPIASFPNPPRFLDPKELGINTALECVNAGEEAAKKCLNAFEKKISDYGKARDFPAVDGTSGLSVHLRFGTISVRECVRRCFPRSKSTAVWLSELIWRDFYHMILDQFPRVEKHAFREKYEDIQWPGERKHFEAWCSGQTGFPIVDAAMRQLNETGWMHNRLRMIVASFLVKDLLIDWRQGERYFASKLMDFDLAANNGGWQWCASTGCDAQPYFRIFSPLRQSQRFDEKGAFIRSFVPELKNFSDKDIHCPATAKLTNIPKGFKLGVNYPLPIVDHSVQRTKALSLFKKA
jgi:deoxyribodipyrimidine photo-lyase